MEIKIAESEEHLSQILDLQNANHRENLSSELKKRNGFVTVKHDLELLKKMKNCAQQIVALENNQVVGYALAMHNELKNAVPVLMPMFDVFEGIEYENSTLEKLNYYVMGQICVAEAYRGKGVFKALYEKHKEVYAPHHDLCITEVSSSNPRSMRAHEKVGFKTIHTFSDETDEWNILSWNWK